MLKTRTPAAPCRRCGHILDAASHLAGDYRPRESDLSVCIACGEVSRFNADLSRRAVDGLELAEIRQRFPDVAREIDQIATARERVLPPWMRKERLS